MRISLALKNLFRNRRRSSLTLLSMIVGIVGLMLVGGFLEYSLWGLRESLIRSQLGHLQIAKKGYFDARLNEPHKHLIRDFTQLEKILYRNPGVDLVTPRLSFSGLVSNGRQTLFCKGIGIQPETENKLAQFERLLEGRHLDQKSSNAIVIGTGLQKGLSVTHGNDVTILTNTVDGMLNAMDTQVTGVIQSGSEDYDSVIAKLPLSDVQKLLNTSGVEQAVVLLHRTEDTDRIAKELRSTFQSKGIEVEVRKWSDNAVFYNSVSRFYGGLFLVLKIIVVGIVFFAVTNTMTMSVFERIREIGVLRAIGTTRSGVLQLFLTEGLLLGTFGCGLGLICSILLSQVINAFGGIPIPPPPGMTTGYQVLIPFVGSTALYASVSTILEALLGTLFASTKAVRMNIVEDLAYA